MHRRTDRSRPLSHFCSLLSGRMLRSSASIQRMHNQPFWHENQNSKRMQMLQRPAYSTRRRHKRADSQTMSRCFGCILSSRFECQTLSVYITLDYSPSVKHRFRIRTKFIPERRNLPPKKIGKQLKTIHVKIAFNPLKTTFTSTSTSTTIAKTVRHRCRHPGLLNRGRPGIW